MNYYAVTFTHTKIREGTDFQTSEEAHKAYLQKQRK